jgi:ribose transport system permease protein
VSRYVPAAKSDGNIDRGELGSPSRADSADLMTAPESESILRSHAVNGRGVYLVPIALLALIALLLGLLLPNFYRSSNIFVILQQASVLGIVTCGQLLVLLVAGIDLSVGAVMSASLVIVAVMNRNGDGLLGLSLAVAVGFGAAVGLINGLLIAVRRVPPFAATLGSLACVQGGILVYTKGVPAGSIPKSLQSVANSGVGAVPYSFFICLGIGISLFAILRYGVYGRRIYAVGRSLEAAKRLAIPTLRIRISAYVLCGALAAVAGIILSAYVGYTDPTIGTNYNLESIAAAVVGGVAFTGGQGGAIGALAGVLFLSALIDAVVLINVGPHLQLIIQGAVLILAVSAYQRLKNRITGI